MSVKYFTWYMKSRKKVDTVRGVDEHENFKSKQWTDKCKEFISQKGVACMVYLDLDADGYRTATGKWSIK